MALTTVGGAAIALRAFGIPSSFHEPHEPRAFDLCKLLRILFGFKKSENGFVVVDGHCDRLSYFPLRILSRTHFNA
jgi:hypothetical protein